jgi:hypothetical protein
VFLTVLPLLNNSLSYLTKMAAKSAAIFVLTQAGTIFDAVKTPNDRNINFGEQ